MRFNSIIFGLLVAILFLMICLAFVPAGSGAEMNEATVKVEYPLLYSGYIDGGDIWHRTVSGVGTREFIVKGETGDLIIVKINKMDETDNELIVSILVGTQLMNTGFTTEPYGYVKLGYRFREEGGGGLEDDDEFCGSVLIGSILGLIGISVYLKRQIRL